MWYIPPHRGEPELVAVGYSGFGAGLNNPVYVLCRNDPGNSNCSGDAGPIPEGEWTIGPPLWGHRKGDPAFVLNPESGTELFSRDSSPPFMIHADRSCQCFDASGGCIVLPQEARRKIAASGDRNLRVVP